MPINNFPVIDQFLEFEQGTFYKFELLIRNTDGKNPLYQEGYSNTNKNILIKSWYIDTKEYYEKMKHEMINLSNLTGARLYMTLDRKSNLKLIQSLSLRFLEILTEISNGSKLGIKGISKTFASETSKIENSCKNMRTIMFDVDTIDETIVDAVISYIENKGQQPRVLKTRKGFHIFCLRKFDCSNWEEWCCENISDQCYDENINRDTIIFLHEKLTEAVSMKPNELGLVYHPMKNFD